MPTATAQGAELFYTEAGDGPPLLLVHGSGPDSRAWQPTIEALAPHHRVIAYDRRGYGRSNDAPLVESWREQGEAAAALLRQLDAAPAAIAGWSAGGLVALHVAAEHPGLVTSLVLAETGIPLPPKSLSYMAMYVRTQAQRRRGDVRGATERFLRWATTERGDGSTWDRFSEERRERIHENAAGMWADFAPKGRPDLSRKTMARVRCPVTLLVGDMSQPWFARSAKAFERMLPDARIETIQGTNHAFNDHQPERFADAIRRAVAHG